MNDRDDSLGDSEDFRGEALRGLILFCCAILVLALIIFMVFWAPQPQWAQSFLWHAAPVGLGLWILKIYADRRMRAGRKPRPGSTTTQNHGNNAAR